MKIDDLMGYLLEARASGRMTVKIVYTGARGECCSSGVIDILTPVSNIKAPLEIWIELDLMSDED